MTLVAHDSYVWIISVMVAGLSLAWIIVDVIRWRRDVASGYEGHDRGDRVFGYVIGILTGVLGCVGTVLYHLSR